MTGDDLARAAVAAQEAERRRLAADVHDGISQRLVSLSYRLSAAADALPDDPTFAREQVLAARDLADLAGAEARAAVGALRPPLLDELGLAGALAHLVRSVPGGHAEVGHTTAGDTTCGLAGHVQTALYRIAQEAVQNVLRHAAATRVDVTFTCSPDVTVLRVRDDGCGFDPARVTAPAGPSAAGGRGLGLAGMRERAALVGAHLDVRTAPGRGTCVEVTLPGADPGTAG